MTPGPVTVRFEPSGREVALRAGGTLYEAAVAAGLPVGRACELEGICGRCGLTVLVGGENLSRESPLERATKAANRVPREARLSCLARVRGPVVVTAGYW
jgi:ferredoxin